MKPTYPRPPIGSIGKLARLLGISGARLEKLSHQTNAYRFAGSKPKSDGTSRPLWEAREPLKSIQGRITSRILRVVEYPDYLQGALAERDYVSNAKLHAGRKTLISLDIAKFYPTCSSELIRRIWQYFFNFPPDVSQILTLLTSRDGELPQGASPSSYLGNLVFWDTEHELVTRLESKGFRYSRFVDDVTVSAGHALTGTEKSMVVREVLRLACGKGFGIKRAKIQLSDRARAMSVHNLNVKTKRPTLMGKQRKRIRASVRKLEEVAAVGRSGREYRKLHSQTLGQVGLLKRFHPVEAQSLLERVRAIRPVPDDGDVALIRWRVTKLCRSRKTTRSTAAFQRRLNQVFQELSALARTRPREAVRQNTRLRRAGLRK